MVIRLTTSFDRSYSSSESRLFTVAASTWLRPVYDPTPRAVYSPPLPPTGLRQHPLGFRFIHLGEGDKLFLKEFFASFTLRMAKSRSAVLL